MEDTKKIKRGRKRGGKQGGKEEEKRGRSD